MNFSQQIKQSNTDEWYTTEESVKLIIPSLRMRGYKRILCPFDKPESNFVKVLTEQGFDVTYGHIETGQDFFDIQDFSEFDAVVSNPPFSKRQAILEKLFNAGVPFAMILNFNGLFDSKARWKLFKYNQFELLIPLGRMRFFNEDGVGNSPNFQSIYVCKNMLPQQIGFIEPQEGADKE
jgi:hypothetical protein